MKPAYLLAISLWTTCFCSLATADNPDPNKILDQARALAAEGKYEEALQKHLWYHENAVKIDPSNSGVRRSFALAYWVELGEKYPKAKEALLAIRDKDAKAINEGRGSIDLFRDVRAINDELNEKPKTVALFKVIHDKHPDLAKLCYPSAEKDLAAGREYKIAISYIPDPLKRFDQIKERRELTLRRASGDSHRKEFAESSFTEDSCRLIEILVGGGRKPDAERVRERALTVRDDPKIREAVDKAANSQNK
jgi:hypothetical protein